MNDATLKQDGLSLSAMRRIDDRSARFEAAWNAGEEPKIEDYLDGVVEPEKSALFRELFLSELEIRVQRDEPMDEAAYLERFPHYSGLIRSAFAAPAEGDTTDDLGFLQPSSRPDSLGRLGHYDVLEVLGKGGFGLVLRAFDNDLQRVVAIKVLFPQLATTSPPRKRFLREARTAAGVHHDNVVQIYAVQEQPTPYLVMEYLNGETLQQRLDRTGPLEVQDVLRIGHHIAKGLAAAHGQGLIHRDIKPANIMLGADVDPHVKLTDFGLARSADDASLTQSGVIAGTPMYMAPEQALGQVLDQRADLFSFGSLLYVMSTGRPPFRAASVMAVLKRVVEDTPRPIQELIPETPAWLIDLIGKLLAKKPEERFQTAKEVADLLGRYQTELQVQGHVQDSRPTTRRRPKRPGRGRRLVVAVGLLLATAVVGFGFFHFRDRSTPTPNVTPALQPAIAPFDAEQARAFQDACAAQQEVPVEIVNSLGMKLRLIPPGEMRLSRHLGVQVAARQPRPFYAGVHEVTVGQFRRFVRDHNYKTDAEGVFPGGLHFAEPHAPPQQRPENVWTHRDFAGAEDWPVSLVTWHDARAFCDWLSKKEGRTYRLPTESEWFWCAWAGSPDRFAFGDDEARMDDHAWHLGNASHTAHPVGGKKANPWGLFDVYGNVNELCHDWFLDGKRVSVAEHPEGPGGGASIPVRGMSFHDASRAAANPGAVPPTWASSHLGFRVVLTDVRYRGDILPGKESAPVVERPPPSPRLHAIPKIPGWPNRAKFIPGSQSILLSNSLQGGLVWDLSGNRPVQRFDKHGRFVHVWGLAVSADGKQALSGDAKGKVYLWNVATGQTVREFTNPTPGVGIIVFAPGEQRFVTLDDRGDVRDWDATTGANKVALTVANRQGEEHFAIAFSRAADRILIGDLDGTLILSDVAAGKELRRWKGHAHRVRSVAFSPDGRLMLSGDQEGTIRVWDVQTEKETVVLTGHVGAVLCAAFTADGRIVSGGQDKTLRVWSLTQQKQTGCFKDHTAPVEQLDLSSDGKYALALTTEGNEVVVVWRLPDAAAP